MIAAQPTPLGLEYRTLVAIVLAGALLFSLLHARLSRRPAHAEPGPRLLARLAHVGFLAAVLVSGATAFYPTFLGQAMRGWGLLVHVASGGPMTVLLAILALSWIGSYRPFNRRRAPSPLCRFSFWLILLFGTITAGTMLLSMLKVAKTEDMRLLLELHAIAGLALVACCIVHAYLRWWCFAGRASDANTRKTRLGGS